MGRGRDLREFNRMKERGRPGALRRAVPLIAAIVVLVLIWVLPMSNNMVMQTSEKTGEQNAAQQDPNKQSGENGSDTYTDSKGNSKNNDLVGGNGKGKGSAGGNKKERDKGSEKEVIINSSKGTVHNHEQIEMSDNKNVPNSDVAVSDDFDFSYWGYSDYDSYERDHPFWARFNYARLWAGRFLSSVQPAGCTSCARKEGDSGVRAVSPVEQPENGTVFVSRQGGASPQLTVEVGEDADAYIKLRETSSGRVVLSFYVRAGSVAKACVPACECDLYYATGSIWYGPEEAFGEDGVYAKGDRTFDFRDPGNSYTYTIGVTGGNIVPRVIDRSEF